MSEYINPFERFSQSLLSIVAGIGAVALGLHFFNKAKDSGKQQEEKK